MLTLIDGAVVMLEDARDIAIAAKDAPTRTLLSNVIGRIEAHRSDLEKKYGLPNEASCESWHDCADRDVPVGCVGCPQAHRLEG